MSECASVNKLIRSRLLSLEKSFFQSLQGGADALAAFDLEMTGFYEATSHSQHHLDEETRFLIYSFAETSSAVIPGLIDLYADSDNINRKLNEDINKVLNELSLDDTIHSEPETCPPYIQPAHMWLVKNLHNPYPSKETRKTLSTQTNTPQKAIDSWFTDIRKRIGWNSLRKKHFSTRKAMIAAATKFFKPSSAQLDSGTGPEDTTHFDEEFALLEDNAKNLYSRIFSTSTLADRLDTVKDSLLGTNPAGQVNSLAREISNQEIEPTPELASAESISHSPSPSSVSSSSPESPQSRKRRQSSSDSNPSIEARPLKRMRINVSVDPITYSPLPSARNNTRQHSPPLLHSPTSPIPTNCISILETPRKRKRPSSDSDSDSDSDQGQTKRAHYIASSPSNSLMEPLPSGPSNSVDLNHWIKSLCGEGIDLGHSIPEPVYETSSLTAAVEIDFYRYASSSPPSSVSSLGPSTPPDYNTDSPAATHQPLSWLESPSLTKAQGYDGLADVTSEFLSTSWSEGNFLFDLNSPGNADFPSQNWDLGLTPAISPDNYSISQVLQEEVDKSTHPWTNEEPAVPIPKPSNQLSPLTSFSENRDNIPQVFQHPSLDKKGAQIRYLQTLLNEVKNVRLDLAL